MNSFKKNIYKTANIIEEGLGLPPEAITDLQWSPASPSPSSGANDVIWTYSGAPTVDYFEVFVFESFTGTTTSASITIGNLAGITWINNIGEYIEVYVYAYNAYGYSESNHVTLSM